MKKIFLFAALACIVLASCQKEASVASVQNDGQQEITFTALSKGLTKSVMGSGASFTPESATEHRTINVAGVMKTADGSSVVDFLENTPFTYDETKGAWTATGKYYPIGGDGKDFHFLAYSETTTATNVEITEASFARWYGSSEVEIQVGEESAKNDIVYSAFKGVKNGKANATFKHSQALVTVWIKTKSENQKITINKIGFKDVKTSGVLNITLDKSKVGTNEDADATAKWIYNAGCTCHFAEMGNYYLKDCHTIPSSSAISDTPSFEITANNEYFFEDYDEISTDNNIGYGVIDNYGCVFDRLFPAQKNQTQKMVINYTLGDLKNVEVELDVIAPPATVSDSSDDLIWAAGKRYVYQITVNVSEILINPTVEDAWNVTTISGTYDPDPATT